MSPCEPCILAARYVQSRRIGGTRCSNLVNAANLRRKAAQSRRNNFSQLHNHTPPDAGPSTFKDTSNILRQVDGLISRSLDKNAPSSRFWRSLLQSAENRLSSEPAQATTKPRVVVYGIDSHSASQELVTVLLEDPLSSDAEHHIRVRDRWQDAGEEPLSYEHDRRYSRTGQSLNIASPWLEQLPMSLVEIPAGSSKDYLRDAFGADVPVLVVNPLVTPISDITAMLPLNPYAILVVNAATSPTVARHIESEVARALHGHSVRVLFVDIERALHAVDVLRSDPTSASAIQEYQRSYESSQVSSLITALQAVFQADINTIRLCSSQSIGKQAVSESRRALDSAFREISATRTIISNLRTAALEAEGKAERDILGANANLVTKSFEKAGKDVEMALHGIKWWKLPLQIDDLTQIVERVVDISLTRQLQNNLLLQTGRLAQLQSTWLVRTDALVASLSPTFTSPVLLNTLAQLVESPSFPLRGTSLLDPLGLRLKKLAFPTNRLHLAAQHALLGTSAVSFASAAAAYSMWMAAYLDGATACGAAALITMATLRWAISHVEKWKRRWLQDWRRIGEGLERDLESHLQKVFQEQVFVVPETACRELEALVKKRTQEVESLSNHVENLELEFDRFQKKSK